MPVGLVFLTTRGNVRVLLTSLQAHAEGADAEESANLLGGGGGEGLDEDYAEDDDVYDDAYADAYADDKYL